MKTNAFNHFQPELFQFLKELRKNNNRDWFNEHKPRFKADVEAPMLDFIAAISQPLKNISPSFEAIPKVNGGSLFRIYRDTRFSKDKTPYKQHIACRFMHRSSHNVHGPCFYLHLEPEKIVIGGGIWMPKPENLRAIREAIRDKPEAWSGVRNAIESSAFFPSITGDTLIRPPRGFTDSATFIEDIKRKSFFGIREEGTGIALNDAWMDDVIATFNAAMPLHHFICRALKLSV